MQRNQTVLLNSAAASHEANYMRTTQASRSRSNAAGPKLPITRQSSDLVRNWAATEAATTAANNQNNSRGNLRRYAAIGLISRKKQKQQSMAAAPISGRSDKENNSTSMDIQSRVATRRNLKAQQKAARKEFRHLLSNIQNNCDQQGPSAGNKKYQLGLRTRNNTPNDLLLAAGQQKLQQRAKKAAQANARQNAVSTAIQRRQDEQKRGGAVLGGRKRPFVELKRSLTLPTNNQNQQTACQKDQAAASRDIQQQSSSLEHDALLDLDQSSLKLSASKRAKTESYNKVSNSSSQREQGSEGLLTKIFESPLGMLRRMWSGFGQNSQGSENEDSPSQYHDCGSGLPTGSSFQKEASRQATQQMFLRGKSFQSASTMGSSSSDRKSENQINLLRSTKQFKAELSLSESRVSLPMRKRTIWPTSTFTLECQPEGGTVDFDLYDECDLPFLDKSTEVGRMVSQNIIQQALDDDVMTDDEMITCANRLLGREVEKAIKQFNSGFDKSYIRNLKM